MLYAMIMENKSSVFGWKTFSEQIAGSSTIVVLYFVQLFLFLLAANFSVCLTLLSKRLNVFHTNLRILIANVAVAYAIVSITQVVSTIRILFLFFSKVEGSLQDQCWCQTIKAIYYTSLSVAELGLVALVIERTIATWKAKSYEKIGNGKIGIFLAISQWLGAICFALMNFMMDTYEEFMKLDKVLSCDQVFTAPLYTAVLLSGVAIVDLLAFVAFVTLLVSNKKKYHDTRISHGEHSLSERYQISENIKTTRFLSPIVLIHDGLSIIGLTILIYIALNIEGKTATFQEIGRLWIFENYFYLLVAIKAILFPVLTIYKHPTLRSEIRKTLHCQSQKIGPLGPRNIDGDCMIVDHEAARKAYFEDLAKAWSKND